MVFGKQSNGEVVEKPNSLGSRSFHMSINERKPDEHKADDSSSIPDNASTIVSKLHPIQPDNMGINLSSRYDLSLLSRSQILVRDRYLFRTLIRLLFFI